MSGEATSATCRNCGEPVELRYCGHCGQDSLRRSRSVGAIVAELLSSVFSYENKFWRTLVPLMLRPGSLSQAYVDGRRAAFFDPVRMFLLCSVVVFFAPDTMGRADFEMPEAWVGAAPE
jgi:hypothetical protein